MQDEWKVVQRTVRNKSEKNAKPTNASKNGSKQQGNSSAFSSLDETWNQEAQQNAKGMTFGSFANLKVEDSPTNSPKAKSKQSKNTAPAPKAQQNNQPEKSKKNKKSKAKKSATVETVQALDILGKLNALEKQYSSDINLQLDSVADLFIEAFSKLEIPFNKIVLEQPLSQSYKMPWQEIKPDVVEVVVNYFMKQKQQALSDLCCKLAPVIVGDVPESKNTAPVPAKVGLLVILSAILRNRPEVLICMSNNILKNHKLYTTPKHMPFLLWIVEQAASSEAAIGLGFWLRVFLPIVSGKLAQDAGQKSLKAVHLPEETSKLMFNYLDHIFKQNAILQQQCKKTIEIVKDGKSTEEYILPSSALEDVSKCIVSGCVKEPYKLILKNNYASMRQVFLSNVETDAKLVADGVRVAINNAQYAAEQAQDSKESNDMIVDSSKLIVALLGIKLDDTMDAWIKRHKNSLRGSAAILTHFKEQPETLKPFLRDSRRLTLQKHLLKLKQTSKRQASINKGIKSQAAKSSEESCSVLVKLTEKKSYPITMIVVGSAVVVTAFVLMKQDLFKVK